MKTAWMFPGQGSQYVGMSKDLAEQSPVVRQMFDEGDRILGTPLSSIMFEGPEEELRQTRNTQPAIFTHSMVLVRLLGNKRPDMVAGHSLGEYSALVAAGALTFADALRLVRLRGELMQRAGKSEPGTMAAIVGLQANVVEEACVAAQSAGVVQPANFNSPGQIVISGSVEGVRAAMAIAKERGAKLVKELVVSGAFHSPLMQSAAKEFREALDGASIIDASIPVYANVTAEPVTKAGQIRELLFQQLTAPVRWEASVVNMVRDGATSFVEIGPGKVLQGLVKRIESSVTTSGIDKHADLPGTA